jgi:hypothetical protein
MYNLYRVTKMPAEATKIRTFPYLDNVFASVLTIYKHMPRLGKVM